MVLSNGDIIQIIIAIIMLVTVIVTFYYSYKTNKYGREEKESKLCIDLMCEERQLFIKLKDEKLSQKERDNLLFSFFEQASLLFLQNKIDKDLFIGYFKNKIINAYRLFMSSKSFDEVTDRLQFYPNFCILSNNLGLDLVNDLKKLVKESELPQEIKNQKIDKNYNN